jgi:aryl-alcohol dehydrogenase-like predicted oxidoreductase
MENRGTTHAAAGVDAGARPIHSAPMDPAIPEELAARLSRLGLGCVTFGREIDQAAAFAMMDHARLRGVTHFDTAEAYGAGASERIVGAWLAARRPESRSLVIATKVRAPYTPARIEESIARSRERLGVAKIDLFYLHAWSEEAADPAVLAALDAAVRDGRVGALGISNIAADQLERVLRLQAERGYAPIRAVQNNHNFAVRKVDERLRALCARERISIVTYSPLGAGFLTGKHKGGVAPGSRFDIVPGHQDDYFNEAGWGRLARLEAIAARTGRTLPDLAFAWALHQPGIASVLVGGRTPSQLDQPFAALAFDQPELLRELEADVVRT